MHIALAINDVVPAAKYGGANRVVWWLGKALVELGHRVTFVTAQGSTCDFASVVSYDSAEPWRAIPDDCDIVHWHDLVDDPIERPQIFTIHGNNPIGKILPANSVFLCHDHAMRHGGQTFVFNGVDHRDYPMFSSKESGRLHFLAKAAWRLKNVRGAIRIARGASKPIDVLGGSRINLKMGFRWTFDRNAAFHGLVDDQRKLSVLQHSAGLVFPVLWPEPFGLAVVESMLMGAPVFATPYGSLPELVTSGLGFLSDSETELSHAIQTKTFDRACIRNEAIQRFGAIAMATGYLELYKRIVDGERLHQAQIVVPPYQERMEMRP